MNGRYQPGGTANPTRAVGACLLAVGLLASACSEPSEESSPVPDSTIVIGSFDFTEGAILSNLYAEVLRTSGFDVKLESVATREIMQPALEQGFIDLVPEYQGTLLSFLHPESDEYTALDEEFALNVALEKRDLVALEAAPGQNQNVIVVTTETASEHNLETISDLEDLAGEMVFGGPPECPARPLCLKGLVDVYGLEFEGFHSLDAGGPLTLAALTGGEIDVGLMFGTDPAIDRDGLVVLTDDRDLQPAENIVPVVRADVLDGQGEMSEPLAKLSARLTTETLRRLNSRVDDAGLTPERAAVEWLEQEGLV